MAKQEYQRRTRALRFGQLVLLSVALINTSLCLAELASEAHDLGKPVASEPVQRTLLLYLGEFDPEADPVELSQIDSALEDEIAIKTEAKTAAEGIKNAANEPKN